MHKSDKGHYSKHWVINTSVIAFFFYRVMTDGFLFFAKADHDYEIQE